MLCKKSVAIFTYTFKKIKQSQPNILIFNHIYFYLKY